MTAVQLGRAPFGFPILAGRMFAAPGEAVVGQGLLDQLHLRIGDTMRLRTQNRPLTLHIVGRYFTLLNNGLAAMYSLETVRRQIDPAAAPTQYALQLAPGADAAAVRRALPHASGGQFGVAVWDLNWGADWLVTVLVALSAALLLIGLIALLNTALLGVQGGS